MRRRLSIIPRDRVVVVRVEIDEKIGLGCTAVGVIRQVALRFEGPVSDRTLVLDGSR